MIDENTINRIVERQKAFYKSGATRKLKFRKEMLHKFRDGLRKWEPALLEALWKDLHKSAEEAYMTEIGLVYGEIDDALKHLGKWARRRRVCSPLTVMPSKSYIVREPLGNTLIVSPWNYPVQLLLSPLVGAISGGCTAVLKPSPYVPTVSDTLQKFVEDCFDEEYIALVQGNRDVNTILFGTRWDLVFYTGSPATAKVLAAAQAQYLTPMVLELGGKSPCIVDKDADIEIAARRIVWGKCLNSGQTCIAPDYLFVHEQIKDRFVDAFRKALDGLYPDGTKDSDYYVHLVRDAAFDRVSEYLKDGEILAGGRTDKAARWIEPTLLGDVDPESPVMTNEIFGPIFPMMTFSSRDEVVDFVISREKPLAFYYFGKNEDAWEMIARTTSGGACINDVIMHVANSRIPFGGVGNSGMGNYHSERSFLAFTHERSVLVTPTWIDLKFRYMPYKLFPLIKKML